MQLLRVCSVLCVFLNGWKWVKKTLEVSEPIEERADECSVLVLELSPVSLLLQKSKERKGKHKTKALGQDK